MRCVTKQDLKGEVLQTYPSIVDAANDLQGCSAELLRYYVKAQKELNGFIYKFHEVEERLVQKKPLWVLDQEEEFNSKHGKDIIDMTCGGSPHDFKINIGESPWHGLKNPVNRQQTEKSVERENARILIIDIETCPLRSYTWGLWKQNISLSQIISDWFMLSFSCKWLGDKAVMSERLTGIEAKNEDDSRITKRLWSIVNEASILVAHNGKKFDIPKINSRFIIHGLNPPSPYKQVDTCDVARKSFGFSSNKLDALATHFGIDNKIKTDFDLWKRCLDGQDEALVEMETYNRMDVIILEKVYLRLRPWIKNTINMGVYEIANDMVCPHCGGDKLLLDSKNYHSNVQTYSLYRCQDCGGMGRSKTKVKGYSSSIRSISAY